MAGEGWRDGEYWPGGSAADENPEAVQACAACGQPLPSSSPHAKKKKRHKKHKEGGFKRKLRLQKAEAAEAIEAAQGEAVVTAAANTVGLR